MKRLLIFLFIPFVLFSCGDDNTGYDPTDPNRVKAKSMVKIDPASEGKGIGAFEQVDLNDPLVADMVARGKAIYEMKCSACHRLNNQRVVGPGWEGVTQRRKPEWIMNMVTNVDIMLEEDPAAQELLKQCLVRMPNQNLTPEGARDVLEFMYLNDGVAVSE